MMAGVDASVPMLASSVDVACQGLDSPARGPNFQGQDGSQSVDREVEIGEESPHSSDGQRPWIGTEDDRVKPTAPRVANETAEEA
jgi:hypothetical protein